MYESGQKESVRTWKHDKLDGLSILYNEDGTEKGRYTFKNGELLESSPDAPPLID